MAQGQHQLLLLLLLSEFGRLFSLEYGRRLDGHCVPTIMFNMIHRYPSRVDLRKVHARHKAVTQRERW